MVQRRPRSLSALEGGQDQRLVVGVELLKDLTHQGLKRGRKPRLDADAHDAVVGATLLEAAHDKIGVDVEEEGGQGAPLSDASVDLKWPGQAAIGSYTDSGPRVHVPQDGHEAGRDAIGREHGPQDPLVQGVKGLAEVDEQGVDRAAEGSRELGKAGKDELGVAGAAQQAEALLAVQEPGLEPGAHPAVDHEGEGLALHIDEGDLPIVGRVVGIPSLEDRANQRAAPGRGDPATLEDRLE